MNRIIVVVELLPNGAIGYGIHESTQLPKHLSEDEVNTILDIFTFFVLKAHERKIQDKKLKGFAVESTETPALIRIVDIEGNDEEDIKYNASYFKDKNEYADYIREAIEYTKHSEEVKRKLCEALNNEIN